MEIHIVAVGKKKTFISKMVTFQEKENIPELIMGIKGGIQPKSHLIPVRCVLDVYITINTVSKFFVSFFSSSDWFGK